MVTEDIMGIAAHIHFRVSVILTQTIKLNIWVKWITVEQMDISHNIVTSYDSCLPFRGYSRRSLQDNWCHGKGRRCHNDG